jgi:membrane fusion protein, multidrug efflux system
MKINNVKRKIWSAALVCAVIIAGCSKKPVPQAGAVPVLVASVVLETVPIELSSFGVVEANMSVTVKSQVAGVLTKIHFTEGQELKQDDLLASIDSGSYDAALKAAQGTLEKDQAQLKNAQKDASRQGELFKKGFVSQNDYDNSVTAADALKATVDSDKAAVENASLLVGYCSIRSPINGVIGPANIKQGNIVKERDAAIATINQVCPIKICFTLPQQHLPAIRRYMAQSNLDVMVNIPSAEKEKPVKASLLFIDNAVDTQTGTIKLWALSQNVDHALWPGQFVNVTLVLAREPNVPVVPSQAIQTGQQGQFVYIVKPDNTVELRNVVVERTFNGSSVVRTLTPGETVVTDGQLRLVPGDKIEIKDEAGSTGSTSSPQAGSPQVESKPQYGTDKK